MQTTIESLAYTAGTLATQSGLPRQTIDNAIKTGALKAMKSGRRWIVLREDALAWLKQCRDNGRIPSPVSDTDRERLAALNRARTAPAA